MEFIKVKNEQGLEITVTANRPENYQSITGGRDISKNWEEYILDYKEEYKPHFKLIKKAIEDLGWVGQMANKKANNTCFVFSDGKSFCFSWRAWGDLMSAIVGKNEGYMAYY
jgi:hypothetical protein